MESPEVDCCCDDQIDVQRKDGRWVMECTRCHARYKEDGDFLEYRDDDK